jgi:hypothetical protein
MEPEGSIPCSQEPSTGPYPQPYQSNPHYPILLLLSYMENCFSDAGCVSKRIRVETSGAANKNKYSRNKEHWVAVVDVYSTVFCSSQTDQMYIPVRHETHTLQNYTQMW